MTVRFTQGGSSGWQPPSESGALRIPRSGQGLAEAACLVGWPGTIAVGRDFEPLVSEELFASVQARLAGHRPAPATHARDHADFPPRRFVRCGECGRPLTGAWSRGRSARCVYYECPAYRRPGGRTAAAA
ncbi:MAG: hypothetical protein E6K81_03415 [Candidatus Eisenbacteria bacterium]|uniref:Recombinase zinc beta ribbon domain-containing protein n=1 Tax=Eiseniibacteriota bacterium TaxID=2212470 RepID=A0A538UCR9_UNCEI|nr:MAG: hypothetical protein E6K81_03415 [Candidatus Eisenbacteria bacterium]